MKVLALAVALAVSLPAAAAAKVKAYSLDGIVLGSNIQSIMSSRGTPTNHFRDHYTWENAAGGTLTVTTDAQGNSIVIDVHAGENEVRTIQLPGVDPNASAVLGESGHINYDPPPEAKPDGSFCGGRQGEPCESFSLSNGAALVVNFGKNIGLADWLLSEVILGTQTALLQ